VSHELSGREAPVHRELTVAQIRGGEDTERVEILFLESARIYKLLREQPGFGELLERLRQAEGERRSVAIGLTSLDSDVIEDVRVT
jgi:hypothetical protein